jgi:two-component system chemotaxis sensor kinase CheA
MAAFEIDRKLLVETFVAEANDILAAMEQAAVALEARPDEAELLHALFRHAHTLKGSSATVGFDGVSELAHDVEGVLARLRAGQLRATDGVVSLLLGGMDAIRTAVSDQATGGSGRPPELDAMRRRLRAPPEAPADTGEAAVAPSGRVDLATSTRRALHVDVAKLDRMLDLSGEIAVARGRLADRLERADTASATEILEVHRETDRLYLDLQDLIMRARLVPVGPMFRRHVRTVRDVAAAARKTVQLVLEGEEVEVDTAVLEQVRDPLTHLVRNAVDHGIEPPDVRLAAGKPACGTVTLRAFHEGGSVVLEVQDDGAGLDRDRIAARARSLGIVRGELSDEAVANLIFSPGLSTSATITEFSGRGVGMDVVRSNVEALRGAVSVRSSPGVGTTITLRLPLTLAMIPGFRVAVGEHSYVIPLDAIVECLELPAGAAEGACGVIALRGEPLAFVRLRNHLDLPGARPPRESVVVLRQGGARAGLVVDSLLGEAQTVVKPLARVFREVPGVSASAILGNGRVALILDVAGLLGAALQYAS